MSSMIFCSKCGKTEKPGDEFTNKDGDTICKECWFDDDDEENNNNKIQKWDVKIVSIVIDVQD